MGIIIGAAIDRKGLVKGESGVSYLNQSDRTRQWGVA
jgi:hypothetical protein